MIPQASGTYHVLVVPYDVHGGSYTGRAYLPQTADAGDLTAFSGSQGSYDIAAGTLKAKVDFLADDQLRLQAAPDGVLTDPAGRTIIRKQPEPQRDTSTFDAGAYYGIRAKDVVLRVYKHPLRFGLYRADDRTAVWQEDAPLRWSTSGLRQSLTAAPTSSSSAAASRTAASPTATRRSTSPTAPTGTRAATTTRSPSTSPAPATGSSATPSHRASTTSARPSAPGSRNGAWTPTTSPATSSR